MGLLRITGFLDERGEFERTGQRVGMRLMETRLQSAAIQATGGSTYVLLYQPRIKFLPFPLFLRDIKKLRDYSFLSYILFIFAYQNWVLTMKYKIFILVILGCLIQLPMSAQQMMFEWCTTLSHPGNGTVARADIPICEYWQTLFNETISIELITYIHTLWDFFILH